MTPGFLHTRSEGRGRKEGKRKRKEVREEESKESEESGKKVKEKLKEGCGHRRKGQKFIIPTIEIEGVRRRHHSRFNSASTR